MPDYRRAARELALRILYEVDVGRQPPRDALNRANEQLAAGVRAGITMAVKEAQAAARRRDVGPAVFTPRTVLRERDRIRRAVDRAVERTAAGFDHALLSLFVEAGRARAIESAEQGGESRPASAIAPAEHAAAAPARQDVNSALWALTDAAKKPADLLERTLQSTVLPGTEIATARRIVSDAVAKMRHVIERRLDIALATARMVARLVRGTLQHRDNLDAQLGALTGDWPLERQSAADRNIMRLAAYEIVYQPETPAPVILNEAVELAKRYGTEESGRFVNGVLAALAACRGSETNRAADLTPPGPCDGTKESINDTD